MKGLLVKDAMLLKNQKQFFIIIMLIGILFLFSNENPSGGISYVMVLSSMSMITTISYDEFENGFGYLFTLPITRKTYVMEKYVFGILSVLVTTIVISVLAVGISVLRGFDYSMKEHGIVLAISFVLAILMFALQVPVRLKFRAEKSTMALMAVFVLAIVIGGAVVKGMQKAGIDIYKVLNKIEDIPFGIVMIFCVVAALTLLAISYIISVRIMNHKEF